MNVPKTMATQHPDNACKPYWHDSPFVDNKAEVEDCFRSFSDLKCQEFMWDWEGKHADSEVVDRLLEEHYEFFKRNELGRDERLIYRLPNLWKEKGYRTAMAFASIIASGELPKHLGLHCPPISEAILPMTTSARELFFLEERFAEISKAFKSMKEHGMNEITIVPLFETPRIMGECGKIMKEYLKLHEKTGKNKKPVPSHLRIFLARSDTSLNSGNPVATLCVKLALENAMLFTEETGIPVFPNLGSGSPGFRGGLSPASARKFANEYEGIKTVFVQSSFRFDHPRKEVTSAMEWMNSNLNDKPREVKQKQKLLKAMKAFEKHYRNSVEEIAPLVNKLAESVPRRRERMLHTGFFGYARSVGKNSLPRAIAFTCALYSIGVPPELIGVGRAIREIKDLECVEENYVNFREDLLEAGKWLNKNNLERLSESGNGGRGWKQISEDVKAIEEYLGEKLGPASYKEEMHANAASNALLSIGKERIKEDITKAAELRGFLG